jgi:hypothetical protein
MDDDRPHLEKKMGHKPYGHVPRLGKIAICYVSGGKTTQNSVPLG